MRVLIVYAHPEPKSFNGAMTRAAVGALTAAGHDVERCADPAVSVVVVRIAGDSQGLGGSRLRLGRPYLWGRRVV